MAFAELRRGVSIELQSAGEWRAGVGQNRAIAGRSAGDFGDSSHANRVMVASGEQGLSRGRAKGGGMKAVELKTSSRQKFRRRRMAWATEGACGAKTCIVNQDNQNVWGPLGRAQLGDRWILGLRVLGIIGDQARARVVWDRKNIALNLVLVTDIRSLPLGIWDGRPAMK